MRTLLVLFLAAVCHGIRAQKIQLITTDGAPVEFCHVCDKTLQQCTITGLDGQFDLTPFLAVTDSIVLKHVGLKQMKLSIRDIGKSIVVPEKIEELQNVYVTDVGPKELFKKAIVKTKKLKKGTPTYLRDGYLQVFDDSIRTDSLRLKDTIDIAGGQGDLLNKFLQMKHGATDTIYVDEYSYQMAGFYENGMVIEQKLLGLDDRFHFKYFINDELLIEEMYFVYHFDGDKIFDLSQEVHEKYLWQGHLTLQLTKETFRPSSLTLEEHFIDQEIGRLSKKRRHQLSIYSYEPLILDQ